MPFASPPKPSHDQLKLLLRNLQRMHLFHFSLANRLVGQNWCLDGLYLQMKTEAQSATLWNSVDKISAGVLHTHLIFNK